ncbi:MAG TPA: D-alanine--D-alanine ligase family protein [Solirubrobacteraceae bacterium]|nr:D-alanine--D-alanine ligase family protein [Solirubrobacteraceae bacterium]
MRVAVLGGGRSDEHEVSLASAASVGEGLEAAGHTVVAIEIARDGRWLCGGRELQLMPARGLLECDVVFPALHGPFGEDGVVQGLLECLAVPYVGSGVASSALCINKVRFKQLMAAEGVDQVASVAIGRRAFAESREWVFEALTPLGMPVFVKPARLGSSVGITKVAEPGLELLSALDAAFEHDELAIVEAAATGVEVECSVLAGEVARASQPGEIVLRSDFYDYSAKYVPGGMDLIVPARVSSAAIAAVQRLALAVFELCGCADLARVDFFVDGDEVLVNELNTMPGFTPTSVYAKLWETDGIGYSALVEELCRIALARRVGVR